MNKEVTLISIRWAARVLTIIPVLAVLFITFEDYPHHFPLSADFPLILSPICLYIAVLLLLLAWKKDFLGIISVPLFITGYLVVVLSKDFYPNGIFICCIPGMLYFPTFILRRR